jgi:hypothetical protein
MQEDRGAIFFEVLFDQGKLYKGEKYRLPRYSRIMVGIRRQNEPFQNGIVGYKHLINI